MKQKIGFLTIGQSPRKDITSDIECLLLPNIEIIERGLLDNLTNKEIMNLKPENNETPLISRLRDGNHIQLSEKKISNLLPTAIDSMKSESKVAAVALLCTHSFPEKTYSCPTIFPSDYIRFLITQILKTKSLGIVIPLHDQIEMTKLKWKKERVVIQVNSPYKNKNSWKEIAQKFYQEKIEAVILDCIGFNIADGRELQHQMPFLVLLPRVILAYAINQLFYYSI